MITLVCYDHDQRGHRRPVRYCVRSADWPYQYSIYYFATDDSGDRVVDLSDVTIMDRDWFGRALTEWIVSGCEVERE